MLRWALIFLIIALVAALFGFTGIPAAATAIPVNPKSAATSAIIKKINATLGLNLFDNRAGGGTFWIHWYCRCGCGNRQIPVLPVPGDLFDLFHHWHIGRQENSVRWKVSKSKR